MDLSPQQRAVARLRAVADPDAKAEGVRVSLEFVNLQAVGAPPRWPIAGLGLGRLGA